MPPQGDQCIFCQLISNPSQLKLVGETDNFYAWLDINPRAKGYTMIVPKEHKESVEEFSASEYQEAMTLTRKVVDKAKKGLDADGVSVTMNIGEAAGQMMDHAYIQVFPRFKDRESAGTPTGAIFQPDEEAKKNIDQIQQKMASVDSSFGETTREAHPDSQNFKKDSEEGKKSRASKKKSSGKDKGKTEVKNRKSGDKKEAIDKIAGQMEGGSPLQLGGLSGGSKGGEKKKKQKASKKAEVEENTGRDNEDEVRIDEDFEGKSFEWS